MFTVKDDAARAQQGGTADCDVTDLREDNSYGEESEGPKPLGFFQLMLKAPSRSEDADVTDVVAEENSAAPARQEQDKTVAKKVLTKEELNAIREQVKAQQPKLYDNKPRKKRGRRGGDLV